MRIVNDRGLIVIDICKELYPTVDVEVVYVEAFNNMTYVIEPASSIAPTRLIVNTLPIESIHYLTAGLTRVIADELNTPTEEIYVKISKLYNLRIKQVKDKYINYIDGTKVFISTSLNRTIN